MAHCVITEDPNYCCALWTGILLKTRGYKIVGESTDKNIHSLVEN